MSDKVRPVFLAGPRLDLVPLDKKRHLENVVRWMNDFETRRYISVHLPMMRHAEEKWFDERGAKGDVVLAIELKDGTHIGTVGLHQINHKDRNCELGIAIGDVGSREKGNGFEAESLMTNYAFSELAMHRVYARVHSDNPRSLKCLEKVGFKEEGRRKEAVFKSGGFLDEILLAVLASEWQGLAWEGKEKGGF